LYDSYIHVTGEYGQDGELNVTVNIPDEDYEVVVDDANNTVVITIPDENAPDVTYSFPPGWTVEREQVGPDVVITATPPPNSGYELRQPDGPNGPVYIYVTVRFESGAHGTFAGSVDYTELVVRRGTVLTAAQVPTPIPDAPGRPFDEWAPSNPVNHTVVAEITFIALYTGDIFVNGEYGNDGEIDVTVNLPPGDYEVTTDGDTIIITIPDADRDDVTVSLPSPDWSYTTTPTPDGNGVIVIMVPPPGSGYELEQLPDGTIVVYIPVRFEPGAYGTLAGAATLRVRLGTTLVAGNVPTVVPNSAARAFTGTWSPLAPVGHIVVAPITFVAQWTYSGARELTIFYYVDGERDTENNPNGRTYQAIVGSTFDLSAVADGDGVLDRNDLDSDNEYEFDGWRVYVNGVLSQTYISNKNLQALRGTFTVPAAPGATSPSPVAAFAEGLDLDFEAFNIDDVVGYGIYLVAVWSVVEQEEEKEEEKQLPRTGIENDTLIWASLLLAVILIGFGAFVAIQQQQHKKDEIFNNIGK